MIENFLSPLDPDDLFSSEQFPGSLSNHLSINFNGFPETGSIELAIIGIKDHRLDGLNKGNCLAPDRIRKELYRLMKPQQFGKVADLGNIEAGETVEDTLFAFQTVLHELKEKKVCVIILGGNEDLALQQYRCLKTFNPAINLVYIGSRVNLRKESWLHQCILDAPNHLFNLSALAYQTYLSEQDSLDAMERMFFDLVRLGTLRDSIRQGEPLLRNAHMVAYDLSAIKQADMPGHYDPSPNGLRSEEACQLARFAGLGQDLRSIGFYNYNPDFDINCQSAKLVAQMCWFFIEGFFNRKTENPLQDNESFMKYRLSLKEYELVFYKSKLTERWWMELPHPRSNRDNTIPLMIPCLYEDYAEAANDELPDRWWRMFQKYAV